MTKSTKLPRPFLKYAGGKAWLTGTVVPKMLPEFNGTYYEPFLGGGAMFFSLYRSNLIKKAYLSDLNKLLMATYLGVQYNPDSVIKFLEVLENTREDYLEIREELNNALPGLDKALEEGDHKYSWFASRAIFLNKTGFNGLMRFNKKGKLNTPYGKNPKADFINADLIDSCSGALEFNSLKLCGYQEALKNVKAGDLVYLDPPYVPRTKTENFVGYTDQGFTGQNHAELAECFKKLSELGAFVILSNSDTPLVAELYSGFRAYKIPARRSINSDPTKRGSVSELLIFSW